MLLDVSFIRAALSLLTQLHCREWRREKVAESDRQQIVTDEVGKVKLELHWELMTN